MYIDRLKYFADLQPPDKSVNFAVKTTLRDGGTYFRVSIPTDFNRRQHRGQEFAAQILHRRQIRRGAYSDHCASACGPPCDRRVMQLMRLLHN